MTNTQILKKVFLYFKPFKWSTIFIMLMIFIETLFSNASSYILGKAIDAATLSNFTLVAYLFIGYIICIQLIPNTMARLRYVYEVKKTGYDLGHHVQKESLFKSLDLSLGQLRREHSGFKQDVLHSGENAINYFYDLITDQIFPIITSLIVAFVGLYFIDVNYIPTIKYVVLGCELVYIIVNYYASVYS